MHKIVSKLSKIAGALLIIIVFLVIISALVFKVRSSVKNANSILGYSAAVVVSGSMSGTIEVNDFVISQAQNMYAINDIVLFEDSNGNLVTHRIIQSTPNGFITKGDFNNTADIEPTPFNKIVGKIIHVVPDVGGAVIWLRSPVGLAVIIILVLAGTSYALFGNRVKHQEIFPK